MRQTVNRVGAALQTANGVVALLLTVATLIAGGAAWAARVEARLCSTEQNVSKLERVVEDIRSIKGDMGLLMKAHRLVGND